jgi:hypothetical protein
MMRSPSLVPYPLLYRSERFAHPDRNCTCDSGCILEGTIEKVACLTAMLWGCAIAISFHAVQYSSQPVSQPVSHRIEGIGTLAVSCESRVSGHSPEFFYSQNESAMRREIPRHTTRTQNLSLLRVTARTFQIQASAGSIRHSKLIAATVEFAVISNINITLRTMTHSRLPAYVNYQILRGDQLGEIVASCSQCVGKEIIVDRLPKTRPCCIKRLPFLRTIGHRPQRQRAVYHSHNHKQPSLPHKEKTLILHDGFVTSYVNAGADRPCCFCSVDIWGPIS